jgi:molybdopterin-binding protein
MIVGVVNFEPRRKHLGYGKEPARTSIPWVAVYSLGKIPRGPGCPVRQFGEGHHFNRNAKRKVITMKLSARNILKGKVKNIIEGSVNDEIVVELSGGQEVVAVVTKTSVRNLGLAKGKDVFAVVKASSVMLAVD